MERNVGISRSLNAGLADARAPVVAVNDADDWSAPERLERQLAVLDAREEVAVVGSRMHEVDEAGRPLAARTKVAAGGVHDAPLPHQPPPDTAGAVPPGGA